MTDHAAIVREALKARGRRTGYMLAYEDPLAPSSPFVEYIAEDALVALSALEQELAEAKRNVELLAQDNTVIALRVTANTLAAAEAERDESAAELEVSDREVVALEAEVRRLREALPPDPDSRPQWGAPDWREWARTTRAALAAGSVPAADNTGKEQT